ncbi:hypothetical protein BS78_05G196500 [Paspalum vaginatum]|nr:hypothetical protein BS78_05G196500 [Paspalum vaginatum]
MPSRRYFGSSAPSPPGSAAAAAPVSPPTRRLGPSRCRGRCSPGRLQRSLHARASQLRAPRPRRGSTPRSGPPSPPNGPSARRRGRRSACGRARRCGVPASHAADALVATAAPAPAPRPLHALPTLQLSPAAARPPVAAVVAARPLPRRRRCSRVGPRGDGRMGNDAEGRLSEAGHHCGASRRRHLPSQAKDGPG